METTLIDAPKTKRSYVKGGISAEEKRRRRLEKDRKRYVEKREEILASRRNPKERARGAAAARKRRENPLVKEKLKETSRRYYLKSKQVRLEYAKRPESLARARELRKKRRLEDPEWREKQRLNSRLRYARNKEAQKKYRESPVYKEKCNLRLKLRRKNDPIFGLKSVIKNRIGLAFRAIGKNKPCKTQDLMGCSWDVLKHHIESQFAEGMTWENRGPVWHIDHIIPFALMDLSNPEHVRAVCHYNNLRPLWGLDNMRKGSRLTEEVRIRMAQVLGASCLLTAADLQEKRLKNGADKD